MKAIAFFTLVIMSSFAQASTHIGYFYVVENDQYANGIPYEEIKSKSISYGVCYNPNIRKFDCKKNEIEFSDKYKFIYEHTIVPYIGRVSTCEIQEKVNDQYKVIFYKNFRDEKDPKNVTMGKYVCKYIWGQGSKR